MLLRLAAADELMAAGFHVIQAGSADEAMSVLGSSMAVDLMLTDVRMPGSLDGLALARHVRGAWPAIKIVVVSGDYTMAPDGPGDAFFPKPYDAAAVIRRIRHLLDIGEQGAQDTRSDRSEAP